MLRKARRRFLPGIFLVIIGISFVGGAQADPNRTIILLSFDGAHPSYFSEKTTPHFWSVATNGMRAEALVPVFPSASFVNHTTMITGCQPDRHGIVANSFIDPKRGKFSYEWDADWMLCEPIWALAEKQGVRTAIAEWFLSASPWHGIKPTYRTPVQRMPIEEFVKLDDTARFDQIIQWLNLPEAARPRLILGWFAGIDNQGHAFGPDAKEVRAAVQRYDGLLGKVLAAIRKSAVAKETDLIIVSDHGMALMETGLSVPHIKDHLKRFGVPEATITASGANANVYVKVAGLRQKAVHELEVLGRKTNTFHAYAPHQLPKEWHAVHPRNGDVILVANERHFFDPKGATDRYDTSVKNRHLGKHGYPPGNPAMHAIFFAQGPDFPPGTVVPRMQMTDIYQQLRRILGL